MAGFSSKSKQSGVMFFSYSSWMSWYSRVRASSIRRLDWNMSDARLWYMGLVMLLTNWLTVSMVQG